MFRLRKKPIQAKKARRVSVQQSRNTAVFSYYNNRSIRPNNLGRGQQAVDDTTKPVARLSHKNFLRKTAVTLAIVCLVVLLVAFNVVVPQPHIVMLGDKKQQVFLQDESVYRQAAQRIIAGSAFNRNKLTFDTSSVNNKMREMFPELAAVAVSLPAFGWEPTVHVQAFTPSMVLIGVGTDDFVLDSQGRAFAPTSLRTALDKLDVPIVQDHSGLAIEERQIALPSDQVAFISEVYSQLRAKNVEITDMTLPAGQGELTVRVKDAPYAIRFNLYDNAREEAGRFLATKAYLDSRGEQPGEYIDVRVRNRVYYQ